MTTRGPQPRRHLRFTDARDEVSRAVDDEVRFHIEAKIEALVAGGMDRVEAEAEARRRFGDVDGVKEAMRKMTKRMSVEAKRGERIGRILGDARFALRQLCRSPAFTVVALLTLGLGIGANTAIFSVVDGILFRPLPFPEPDELVSLWSDVTRRGGPDDEWLSWANFADLRQDVASLEALAAWGGASPILTERGEARQLLGGVISPGMFSEVLGVEAALGRGFGSDDHEPGSADVVLLSHSFWQSALGGDPDVLGQALVLNDVPSTVVGVMPEGFRPPFVPDAELWIPTQVDLTAVQGQRGGFSWRAVGRLAEGVSVERGGVDVAEVGRRLEAAHPSSNTGMGFRVIPLRDDLVAEARAGLLVLLGAVAFVLLVACVNVANLLLARATSRESEMAVRIALGAGQKRLATQLLTESLVLAALGGLVGTALAFAGTDLLVGLAPPGTPRLAEVSVDARALGVSAAVTLLAGLLFGMVPAILGSRWGTFQAIREGGMGQSRSRRGILVRSTLVTAQVAMALVLLVGSGLLLRSFANLRARDLGFRPEGVVTMRINLPASRYPDADARRPFYNALHEGLTALHGVSSVAFTNTVPLTGFDGDVDFVVEGRPLPEPGHETTAWFRRVTPAYFETMGIRLVDGRAFDGRDHAEALRVVIVNETLARRAFPAEGAVGKRINVNGPEDPVWREIVGVAADIRNFGVREESRMAMYVPYDQVTTGVVFPVVRTALAPEDLIPAIRAAVAELDATLAVAQVLTMDEIVARSIAQDRLVALLLALFAGVGLLLSVVGLYGVVSYGVNARLREMGVRMALGAGGGQIRALVVRQSLLLVGIGLGAGLVGASVMTRFMEGLLFNVSATDPVTFVGVAVLLGASAVLASLVPAVRATRVDPVVVLRSD
jgi:putative ABC transport system permease protein